MATNYQIATSGNGLKLTNPETAESVTNSIDLTSLRQFTATAAGPGTWTFNNTPTGKKLTTTFKITLTNGGTGIQTWPTSVKWSGGVAPTLSASGTEVLQFTTSDNGVTWYGNLISTTAASSSNYSSTWVRIPATAGTIAAATFAPFTVTAIDSTKTVRYTLHSSADPQGGWTIQYSSDGGTTWATVAAVTNMPTWGGNGTGVYRVEIDVKLNMNVLWRATISAGTGVHTHHQTSNVTWTAAMLAATHIRILPGGAVPGSMNVITEITS